MSISFFQFLRLRSKQLSAARRSMRKYPNNIAAAAAALDGIIGFWEIDGGIYFKTRFAILLHRSCLWIVIITAIFIIRFSNNEWTLSVAGRAQLTFAFITSKVVLIPEWTHRYRSSQHSLAILTASFSIGHRFIPCRIVSSDGGVGNAMKQFVALDYCFMSSW